MDVKEEKSKPTSTPVGDYTRMMKSADQNTLTQISGPEDDSSRSDKFESKIK